MRSFLMLKYEYAQSSRELPDDKRAMTIVGESIKAEMFKTTKGLHRIILGQDWSFSI